MKEILGKQLPPDEIVNRLVDSCFGIGYEVYGEESVEITITPEFSRGEIAIDHNGNKIYKKNSEGKMPLEVSYCYIKAKAIEGDFERPYPKLDGLKLVKMKSVCAHIGNLGKLLKKKGVDLKIFYVPFKESDKKFILHQNFAEISPESLDTNISVLVKKIGVDDVAPSPDFVDPLMKFVFK